MWQTKTMEEIIIYEHATFWTDSSGILFCKFQSLNANNKLDYKIAELYIDTISKLSNGMPMPLLIDLRDTKGTFSIAAAQLLANSFNNLSLIISEAYVVNSLSINLLIRSYKRLYNTNISYSIFEDMTMAEKYCLDFKNNISI